MRKFAVMILVAFGLVSVSFGVDLYGNEENYQKLKAEMEEMEKMEQGENWDRIGATCSWGEDGKVVINRGNESYFYGTRGESWCGLKNVLAFFDELRAMEAENDNLNLAIAKVREMPRFKNDDGIYTYMSRSVKGFKSKKIEAVFNDYAFWKRVFEKLEVLKMEIRISSKLN